MNIQEAREIIKKAIARNSSFLDLNSITDSEKLTSNDLIELLPDLKKIKSLTGLGLNNNQISNIEVLGQLKSLTELYLSNNQISDIEVLGQLTSLKRLDLDSNQISDIEVLGQLTSLEILYLRGNEKLNFPEEILNKPLNAQIILNFINEYYSKKKKRRLNEAKLVVIGEANIGKTCVINRLVYNEFRKTDSTHGIEIIHWDNIENKADEKEIIDVNVWDFGGQEIMHATHQFFFTNRTVYVLVINARENEDANKTEEWLQRISSFSKNSPIFIVGNKIDENDRGENKKEIGYFDIDKTNLNKKFPEMIKGFYGVSSKQETSQYKKLFKEFKQALIKEIKNLEGITNEFPAHWFKVKDELEQMQDNKTSYIELSEYITKCTKAGIDNEVSQTTWLDFLNDLGIIITYRKDSDLNNTLILNPAWITKGVYALVDNSQIAVKKGILRFNEISKYLTDQNEYPKKKQKFIIKMMEKFKLIIPIKKDEIFMIPDLLPKEEPHTGNWENCFHFQFEYENKKKSIIRRFIVDMYYLHYKETFWRNGIVLKYGENTALVKADIQAKTIFIKIDGNENTRREFFSLIRNKLDEIHNEFDNLKVYKKVGHPSNPKILEDYDKLLQMERDGQAEVYVKDFGNYKVGEFLLSINKNSEDQAILQPQKTNKLDERLESSLQLLKNKEDEFLKLGVLVKDDEEQFGKIIKKANKTARFKSIAYWIIVVIILAFWIGLVLYLGWDYMEKYTYVASLILGLLFTFISCWTLDEYAGFSPKKIMEKELAEQMNVSNFDYNLYEFRKKKLTEIKHEIEMMKSKMVNTKEIELL